MSIAAGFDTVTANFALTPEVLPLEEVVFTATRTLQQLKEVPVATELVRRGDIRRRAAVTAAQALETEIGLDVQEDFSGQGVTLQGVDPDKVLILVDGARVIGRVNGSIDLDQISTDNIKQIEVVKGAVSTLYGSEAIGGVVNIITEPAQVPLMVGLDFSAGGYIPDVGLQSAGKLARRSDNLSTGASLGLKRGRAGIRGSLRRNRTGLIDIDPSTNHTEGVDAADRFNGNFRVDWDVSDIVRGVAAVRYLQEEKSWVEDGGLVSVPVSYDDRETNRAVGLSADVICTPRGDDRYSARLYHTGNRHLWEKLTRPYGRVRDYSRSNEDYSELALLMTRRLSQRHLVTAGGDLYIWGIGATSELGETASDYSSTLTAWDAFTQDEWHPSPKVTLLPGVRWERHEVYGNHWSPRLSAMWTPAGDLVKVRISAGYGYRAPSAKELYFTFNHASAGYIVRGDSSLKPEESQNYSLSLEHTYKNRSSSRITFFYNDLRNLIDFDSIGASEDYYTGIYQYRNITTAWTRGVEVERTFRFNGKFTAALAYAYLETRDLQTGGPLIRRPKHSARWNLSWREGPWTTQIWGRYTDRMLFSSIWTTDDLLTDEWTEPYSLWNIAVTRDLGRGLQGYLRLDNIFDRTHPRYGPRSGRVATLGVRWSYYGK